MRNRFNKRSPLNVKYTRIPPGRPCRRRRWNPSPQSFGSLVPRARCPGSNFSPITSRQWVPPRPRSFRSFHPRLPTSRRLPITVTCQAPIIFGHRSLNCSDSQVDDECSLLLANRRTKRFLIGMISGRARQCPPTPLLPFVGDPLRGELRLRTFPSVSRGIDSRVEGRRPTTSR